MRTTPAVSRPTDQPDEPFTVSLSIGVADRIASSLFTYRAQFAAARRRPLMFLGWMLLVILLMAGFNAWSASGKAGIGPFLQRLAADLTGWGGVPIVLLAIGTLFLFVVQPWLWRKRLRRWFVDEGLDGPMPLTLRFEPWGMISDVGDRRSLVACRRIAGLAEQPDHIYVRFQDIEDTLVLPRAQLALDVVERVRRWSRSCHAEALSPPAPPEMQGETATPLLTLRFVPSEADRAARLTWQMRRPTAVRRRRNSFVLAFLLALLVPPAIIALFWLLDPERVPFAETLPLFLELFGTHFWKQTLALWALIGVVMALGPLVRRFTVRQYAKQLHGALRHYETEARIAEEGMEWREDGLTTWSSWASFRGREHHDGYVLLLQRDGEPLLLPTHELDAAEASLLADVLTRRISDSPEARS